MFDRVHCWQLLQCLICSFNTLVSYETLNFQQYSQALLIIIELHNEFQEFTETQTTPWPKN